MHGANGYLLHQFLAADTNHRTDEYGGPASRRMKLLLDVVDAVVAAIGSSRVGVRISPGARANGIAETNSDISALYPLLVTELDQRSLAYLHVAFADPTSAVWPEIRQRWSGTLIGNPIIDDPTSRAEVEQRSTTMVEAGADLVALGRSFLATPDLMNRLRDGHDLNPLDEAPLMYTQGAKGYTDYPLS